MKTSFEHIEQNCKTIRDVQELTKEQEDLILARENE